MSCALPLRHITCVPRPGAAVAGGLGWAWFGPYQDPVTGQHYIGEYETRKSFITLMQGVKALHTQPQTYNASAYKLPLSSLNEPGRRR